MLRGSTAEVDTVLTSVIMVSMSTTDTSTTATRFPTADEMTRLRDQDREVQAIVGLEVPTPQQLAELRYKDARVDVQWRLGQGRATACHAGIFTDSAVDTPAEAAEIADRLWAAGKPVSATFWYGYAAKAIRLDPDGGHAVAG